MKLQQPTFTHTYSAGDVIFHEGDTGSTAFIIEEGQVEISITKEGEKLVLAEYHAGDVFGEMALIDDAPRSATATVLEPTRVIAIDRSLFDNAFKNAHPMVSLFLHSILHNLRKANSRLGNSMTNPEKFYFTQKDNHKYQHAHNETVYLIRAEQELIRALGESEFELHYQPVVDISANRIVGFEALIRWQHPERGLVPPLEFIGLAEQTGLIAPIGDWIIDQACLQLQQLLQEAPDLLKHTPDLFFSINLSAKQFIEPHLINQIKRAIKKHHISPVNLKFEITESILMDNPEAALSMLQQLRKLGIRIAIDDFGTGYSSLSYLHTFPIDTLKIDRSFVNSMQSNNASKNIVHAVICLSNSIGMDVIAEGVETEQQKNDLQELGCQYIQGFYFYRPKPFTEILELVKK